MHLLVAVILAAPLVPYEVKTEADLVKAIREHYTKSEHKVRMRDGVRLYTNVFAPKDRSRPYPIIMLRTTYGCEPYGVDNYPAEARGWVVRTFAPSPALVQDGFIFVHQDVRGRMMSEGTFVDVRPRRVKQNEIDEPSDTYDTVDWLVKNVPNNNGKVGVWGVSYPGFYAAQAGIDAHPAVKAISPQAPVTDWFLGDDFHHNGAFFLADAFLFYSNFGRPRPEPTAKARWDYEPDHGDIYDFFLKAGPIANLNTRYLKGEIAFWNDLMAHGTRDAWWQARDPRPHYKGVKPAVLTVGGWFDAEDVWGAFETYRAFEKQSPGADNAIVVGPWRHGGWLRSDGDSLGDVSFQTKTSLFYREQIIAPFFRRTLKGEGEKGPEAWMFETGTNEWRRYDAWPPKDTKPVALYLDAGGALSAVAPSLASGSDAYPSDPAKPVPFSARASADRESDYMVEDQRFAARRPDVRVYELPAFEKAVTVAGPVSVDLWVQTTGSDADFVVKLIDVYPDDVVDPDPNPNRVRLAGFQQLVRGEIMRGKFRNGFDKPEAFVAGQPARVRFTLPDTLHTWRAGHRLMVQVQSSWFPLADRNPQTFVDIYAAKEVDFVAATHTLYRQKNMASSITLPIIGGAL